MEALISQNATPPPFAMVAGQPYTVLPEDLYIPPDALEVFLETFEGPLDLLLYLIKKQNVDILNIPIAQITEQYMHYIALMDNLRIELAAEYLVMAAMLAEIKSRLLLPKPVNDEAEEADPRAQLVRRLQEYERFKLAAQALDELPRCERDFFPVKTQAPDLERERPLPEVTMQDFILAFAAVLKRVKMHENHHVQRDTLSIRQRMTDILSQLSTQAFLPFEKTLILTEGRAGVVVSFIAILELLKQSMIQLTQMVPYGPIHMTLPQHAADNQIPGIV